MANVEKDFAKGKPIWRVLLDKAPYRLANGGQLATGRDKRREARRFVLRSLYRKRQHGARFIASGS